jgi:putative flavoprotein involved in K+ transport
MNRLPGEAADAEPRDGFPTRDEWVARLQAYAASPGLPILEETEVTGVTPRPDGTFGIRVEGSVDVSFEARVIVVATGIQREPRIPALAARPPGDVLSIHTAQYLRPAQLPPGGVLVVGAAQSGGQVAEDLIDAGRTVHLSTSRVARVRRRTRGHDTLEWLAANGFFDQTVERLPDPALRSAAQPITSGVGRHGHTLSLQLLQARGARLLGRLCAIDRGRFSFADDLAANVRFADEQSALVNRQVADWLAAQGLDMSLPPLEADPADDPHPAPDSLRSAATIDVVAEGISAVIWATGFEGRFDWLPASMPDERGAPRHVGPSTPIPGLFVLGFPWLTRRASGIVFGVGDDARLVADLVTARLVA